jgi:hypothetical protein
MAYRLKNEDFRRTIETDTKEEFIDILKILRIQASQFTGENINGKTIRFPPNSGVDGAGEENES